MSTAIKYISLEEIEKLLTEKYGFGKFQLDSIRELPSLDIDSLQRYDYYSDIHGAYMDEDDNGEYVRYESLVDLLRN